MTKSAGPALKRLHAEFGDRIAFLALYVREAHPGEHYPQPETFDQKLRHARDYAESDRLPWPVAVDSLDGDLHRTLDPKPNAIYVMDRSGRVAFRTLWANEREGAIRAALTATSEGRTPVGERTPRLLPMLRGTGVSAESWRAAGSQAERDMLTQAPPMYATAKLAERFQPLPPAVRTLAGTAISVAAGAVLVATARRLRSSG